MKRINNLDGLKEAIKGAVTLQMVVESYGVELSGGPDVYMAKCPFHMEKTPSFGISTEKQLYFCHGACKDGGDIFKFVQQMEQIPFTSVMFKLAELGNVPTGAYLADLTPEERHQEKLFGVNADLAESCKAAKNNQAADAWLQARGLSLRAIEEYGVGFSFKAPFTKSNEDAESLGLTRKAQWTNVVVIPVRDTFGRVAGFRNRTTAADADVKLIGPNEKHPLPMPQVYGLYEARKAIRKAGYAILVEGEPDVWQMVRNGFENTVGVMGSKLNDEQLTYLESIGVRRIVVLADNDEAGRAFSMRVAKTRYKSKIIIKIASLKGDGKDPDEVLLTNGPEPVTESIDEAKHSFEYLIRAVVDEHSIESMTDKLDVLHELKEYFTASTETERQLGYEFVGKCLSMDKEIVADYYREDGADSNTQNLFDIRNEKIVLATMMDDPHFVGDAILTLKPEHFYLDRNRAIFTGLSEMFLKKIPIGFDSVRSHIKNRYPNAVQVVDQIKDMSDGNIARVLSKDVRDKAIRRDIKRLGQDITLRIADTTIDSGTIAQSFSAKLTEAIVGGDAKLTDAKTLANARVRLMHERIKNPNAIIGLDLGPDWRLLNQTLHGLQRKRYMIVAAPSGEGKTAVACTWALRTAITLNEPTLYLTFETGKESLTDRIIASVSGVQSDKAVTGFISSDEVEEVHLAAAMFAESPLMVTERGRILEEAIAIIRHDVLSRGCRIVFVDYIQLMRMANKPRGVGRPEELGIISEHLLELAHDLDITIVALAQINRAGIKSGNADKEDIGDSYKIVQDADIVYILRPKTDEEIEKDGELKGDAFGLLDKHRHGKAGFGIGIKRDLEVMRIQEAHALVKK